MCINHTSAVRSESSFLIYKNRFCAFCHNESESSLFCHYGSVLFRGFTPYSLQVLFDISELIDEEVIDKRLRIIDGTELSEGNSQANDEENLAAEIKKWLTIIGLHVSIFSILALIVIYITNEALRNFPGKLLICLSISIFFSQVSFLVATYVTQAFQKRQA